MLITPKHAIYSTNKKLALSLAVIAGAVFLISIGVMIEGKIVDGAERKAQMYQTALQTSDDNQLNYSIDTQQGRVLAEVTVKAVDLVKFPEMNKEFPAVYKEEETYTKHSREVCTYDDEGNVEECHTEYYYTWDTTGTWEVEANKVNMAGRDYPKVMFSLASSSIDAKDIINGETGKYVVVESNGIFNIDIDIWGEGADEGDKRTSYDVLNLPQSGTVFLNTSGAVSAVFGGRIGLDSKKPAQLITDAQKSAQTQSTVFKVFWVILVLAELLGLGYWVWFREDY